MNQHILFAIIALIISAGLAVNHATNPPPPADYKIIYLGSPKCGACVHWKKSVLPAWRSDPVSASAELEIATLSGRAHRGGYGPHDPVFREAFKGKSRIKWPSFVVYNHGELERVYTGLNGWKAIEKKVRAEAKRHPIE